MELFSRIGMGTMLLVSTAVGARLLWLALHTRRLPELIMGLASISIGSGAGMVVLGGERAAAGSAGGATVLLAGVVVTSLGGLFLCAGMWQIFRVGEAWAALLTGLAAGVLAGSCIALIAADHGGAMPTGHVAYRVGISVRILAFGWVAIESLHYAGMLRRQAALGLAEPLMVHRFRCWGISSGTAALGYVLFVLLTLTSSGPGPLGQGLLGLLGSVTGATMWLAFLPPAFYRRWVEARPTASA